MVDCVVVKMVVISNFVINGGILVKMKYGIIDDVLKFFGKIVLCV